MNISQEGYPLYYGVETQHEGYEKMNSHFDTIINLIIPLSSPPVSLAKSWSLIISLKKIYIENFRIRNYFKKDFLNFSFHYVRYCNHLVTFLEKFPHQFAFANSQSS